MSNSFLQSEVQRNRGFEVGWKDQSLFGVTKWLDATFKLEVMILHDPGVYTDRLGRTRHLMRWSCV